MSVCASTIAALLRDLATIPVQGIESTWRLLEGALQTAAPEEAEAAMGVSGPLSAISGSMGGSLLSAATVQTPALAACGRLGERGEG